MMIMIYVVELNDNDEGVHGITSVDEDSKPH